MRKKDYNNKNTTLNVERKMRSESQREKTAKENIYSHTEILRNRITYHVRACALLTVTNTQQHL